MRETRLSGSEGGGFEFNRFSLPLSACAVNFFTASQPFRTASGEAAGLHQRPEINLDRSEMTAPASRAFKRS